MGLGKKWEESGEMGLQVLGVFVFVFFFGGRGVF